MSVINQQLPGLCPSFPSRYPVCRIFPKMLLRLRDKAFPRALGLERIFIRALKNLAAKAS